MRAILIRRLVTLIPSILLAVTAVFALRLVIPGGPAQALAGDQADAETVATIERELGLDKPLIVQYWDWLSALVQGDLGMSYTYRRPVSDIIVERLGPTLELVVGALFITVVVGGLVGVWAAVRRRSTAGRLVFMASGVGLAVPEFWLAMLGAGLFGLELGLVPAVGFQPIDDGLLGNLRSVVLPILILSFTHTALLLRLVRSSMANVLDSAYTRTAWATGLRPGTVYLNYSLRAALIPTLAYLPIVISALVGASALVERVFSIPGLGGEIVSAAQSRDFMVLQGITLFLAVTVLLLTLIADIATALIDPRTRS